MVTTWTVTVAPSRVVPNVPDTRGYGEHIRGRVRLAARWKINGHPCTTWSFEVTSNVPDEPIRVTGDDGYRSMAEAFAACEFATAAAREAWMRGFGRRARGLR